MREIKFRMWHDEEKIMIDGDSLAFEDYLPIKDLLSQDGIMQYTGLKDKNGKEIYEGDIISNPRYEETYMVEYYIDGYVGWGDDRRPGCYLITDEDIEVIGNIYENPELLK